MSTEQDSIEKVIADLREIGRGSNPGRTSPDDIADRLAALQAKQEQEAVAWMTHHDEPMLFPARSEADKYCDDDEQPIPLYTSPPIGGSAVPDERAARPCDGLRGVCAQYPACPCGRAWRQHDASH